MKISHTATSWKDNGKKVKKKKLWMQEYTGYSVTCTTTCCNDKAWNFAIVWDCLVSRKNYYGEKLHSSQHKFREFARNLTVDKYMLWNTTVYYKIWTITAQK